MSHLRKSLRFIRVLSDFILISVSFWLASGVPKGVHNIDISNNQFAVFGLILIIWFLGANAFGLYDEFRSRNFGVEVIAVIRNVFIVTLTLIVFLFFFRDKYFNRLFLLSFSIFSLSLITTKRLLFRVILIWLRKKGRNLRRVLIIGAGTVGREFAKIINANLN